MKTLALFLALAIALPLGASAQVPPPAGPPHHAPMTDAQRQAFQGAMKSFHDKEAQLSASNRKAILGALTPANRTLLAHVAGQLAIADVPDRKAAAAQLQAALSSGEQQAILSADKDYHTQQKALFEQFRAQMKSMMPSPPPGSQPHAWPSHKPMGNDQKHTHTPPDAGTILLMTATGHHGGMHFGGMMMHRHRR